MDCPKTPTSVDGVDHLIALLTCVKRMGWNRAFKGDVLYGELKCDNFQLYAEPLHSIRLALQDSKSCVATLTKLRDKLGKKIRTLQRRSNPLILEDGIRRLPDELLARIFEIGHLSTGKCDASLRASHVSSRFRQIALQTPLLWTRINARYTKEQMQTFLSRAGNLGLDVICRFCPRKGNPFLDVVGSLSSRWASLTIMDFSQASMISGAGLTAFPNLKYISQYYAGPKLSEWDMPSLSHHVGRSVSISNQQLSQLTSLEVHFVEDYLDVPSLARAFYQAKNLQDLSLRFINCKPEYTPSLKAEEIPPPHSFSVNSLKITISGDGSVVHDFIQPMNSALAHLSPLEVDISLESTPITCLYDARGEIFPHGSTIKLRIARSCDLLDILARLVRRCDIARSVHFEAPMGYFSAKTLQTCDWSDFSSLRHLRFQNCDGLLEEYVKTIASNLFFDEAEKGIQLLEFVSCKRISEDFLLNLSDDYGERVKWSF
ncbi:hypothetical protein BD410DRAFT_802772 [Rickenella mellea]|uniref:F-box domain-containing protein n=1 Tax=Rickenella mellea TaxID=50990 RepID=A0A4Y7Q9L3_9AGAM|nr:hypothetical protein BD410DRAFT_802772 [Rickenella mellea]